MEPVNPANLAPTTACGFARASRAFTLLELLVALAMAGIIAGSLYASLRSGFRARAQAEAQVEPVRTAELATALLRADFESARPADGPLSGPFIGQDLTGDQGLAADSVSFYTLGNPTDPLAAAATAAAPAGPSGVMAGDAALTPTTGEARQVEIGIVSYPGPNGTAEPCLVRRVNTNLLAQVTAEPYEEILCRGVRAFNIRYYEGLSWQDSWDSTLVDNNIPVAVEVTLELDRSTEDQQRIIQFPRVFLLSCSTLSATSATGTGATGGGR